MLLPELRVVANLFCLFSLQCFSTVSILYFSMFVFGFPAKNWLLFQRINELVIFVLAGVEYEFYSSSRPGECWVNLGHVLMS